MALSVAQEVGLGGLMGGIAAIGTSVLLRYYADDTGKIAAAGQPTEFPVWWEHAPLFGILAGGVAVILTYYLFDKSIPAAVACGMTALIAGVAPEIDAWITDARAEKDLETPKTAKCADGSAPRADGTCADGSTPTMQGLHGSDVVEFRSRIAALEAAVEQYREAA